MSSQILYDPSPTPPRGSFSPEFCSFVDACLQKDADARPTAEQARKPYILFLNHFKCFNILYLLSVIEMQKGAYVMAY